MLLSWDVQEAKELFFEFKAHARYKFGNKGFHRTVSKSTKDAVSLYKIVPHIISKKKTPH